MKNAIAMALLFLGVALTGCSNTSCKDGCDQLDTCGYKSSGFSCDDKCQAPLDKCAACINDTKCADIPTKCAEDCAGVSFEKK